MIDIRNDKHLVEAINAMLNNGCIVEIKKERHGIVAVEVSRKLRYPEKLN